MVRFDTTYNELTQSYQMVCTMSHEEALGLIDWDGIDDCTDYDEVDIYRECDAMIQPQKKAKKPLSAYIADGTIATADAFFNKKRNPNKGGE